MNIYELPAEIESALELLHMSFDDDGVLIVDEEVYRARETALFELQNQNTELLEWYLKSRANTLASLPGIEEEIKRLSKIAEREQKKVERIEKILDYNLCQMIKDKPLEIGNFRVSYRKSDSVLIEDETKISILYKKSKVVTTIDKIAIKEAIKSGKVVEGASLEIKKNLQIK